jgi:hypothetical protein
VVCVENDRHLAVALAHGHGCQIGKVACEAEDGIAVAVAAPGELPEAGFDDDGRTTLAGGFEAVGHGSMAVRIDREDGEVLADSALDKGACFLGC